MVSAGSHGWKIGGVKAECKVYRSGNNMFLYMRPFKGGFSSVINNTTDPLRISAAILSYFNWTFNDDNGDSQQEDQKQIEGSETILLSESFNNLNNWWGDIGPGKWRCYSYDGSYGLVLDSDNLAGDNNIYSNNYSTAGYSGVIVTFEYKPRELDPDDARFYIYTSSGYVEIEDFSNGIQSSWNDFYWESDDPKFLHDNFHLRFREKSSSAIEYVYIDNLYIKAKV